MFAGCDFLFSYDTHLFISFKRPTVRKLKISLFFNKAETVIVITDVGPIVTSITFENKKICQKRDEREVLATSKL